MTKEIKLAASTENKPVKKLRRRKMIGPVLPPGFYVNKKGISVKKGAFKIQRALNRPEPQVKVKVKKTPRKKFREIVRETGISYPFKRVTDTMRKKDAGKLNAGEKKAVRKELSDSIYADVTLAS